MPSWLKSSFTPSPRCAVGRCRFKDGGVSNETDVVMVMGVRLQDQHKPPVRWPGQLYVMFAHESPVHYQKSSLQKASSPWRYAFNMTHTYTQDSDVFWPVNQLRFEYTPHLQKPNYSEIFKNKNRTAVWLVSHCSTQSLREKYVKEMQKYIDVDSFGSCTKRPVCPDINDTGCLDKVFNTYKFYLGFENSVCVDYVTEKFFNAFTPGRHVVPVVMGGADYDRLLPNGSFINTGWFQTARDLAMYLKVVGQDEATYTRYLKVKDMYRPTGSQGTLCLMCDALFGHPAPPMEGPMLNAHTEMTLSKDLEETFLTCSICGEPFNQSDRSPKLLTCNHTFCQMCLVTQSGGRGDLYCPMCRAVTHLSGDVCKLPVDHKVNQIRDCVDDIKHQQKNICPQHEFQYLSFFCQKCFVPVCRDCTVLDHTTDKGHVICDVKSALKSYSDLMDAAEKSAQLTVEKMAAEKEKHEQEVVAMENMKEEVTNEIVAKFSELHQYLEQRQSTLIAEVNTFVDHATTGEQTRGEIVGAKRRQLEDLLKEFQASRQNKVTAKIFRSLRQIREVSEAHLELLDILQDPDKRCSFEACKEEELLCRLTDFGEVRAAPKTDMVKPGDQN